MNLENKYGVFSDLVLDMYVNNELLTTLNTLASSDFIKTKKNRFFLKLKDALVDKNIITYIKENQNMNFVLSGTTKVIDAITGKEVKMSIAIDNAELIYYKLPIQSSKPSTVTMTFELHPNDKEDVLTLVALDN